MLTEDELERYSRQIVLNNIGETGQVKLRKSRVCIVGVGGLGWLVALQLAAMGVGYIKLIDRDIVELSNLQRQLIFETEDINKPKVEAAARRLRRLNPNIDVKPVMVSISLENIYELLNDVDVVVDCLDNFKARMILNYGCIRRKTPLVYSSAIRLYGAVHTVIPGKSACLECLYGDVETLEAESCAEVGVLPTVLGVVSSTASQEVLNIILSGNPLLTKHLLIIDLESYQFDKILLERNPQCRICGEKPVELKPSGEVSIERLCADGSFMISPPKPVRIDLKHLEIELNKKFKIRKTTLVFTEFYYTPEITITVVRSGGILFKGVSDAETVRKIYFEIKPLIDSSKS